MILPDKAMPGDHHHEACVAIVCDAIVHDEERLRCDAMSALVTLVRCDAIAMGAHMGIWPSRLIAMEACQPDSVHYPTLMLDRYGIHKLAKAIKIQFLDHPPRCSATVSYTHLTLPTNREV